MRRLKDCSTERAGISLRIRGSRRALGQLLDCRSWNQAGPCGISARVGAVHPISRVASPPDASMNHAARTKEPCGVRSPRIRRVRELGSSRTQKSGTRRNLASVRSRSRCNVRTSTFHGDSASHAPGRRSFLQSHGSRNLRPFKHF